MKNSRIRSQLLIGERICELIFYFYLATIYGYLVLLLAGAVLGVILVLIPNFLICAIVFANNTALENLLAVFQNQLKFIVIEAILALLFTHYSHLIVGNFFGAALGFTARSHILTVGSLVKMKLLGLEAHAID